MQRRTFIGSFCMGSLAAIHALLAQQKSKFYRIGVVGLSSGSELAGPTPRAPTQLAFLRGLRELGYVYGEHFIIEAHGSEGQQDRMTGIAAELVAAKVDVIVATGAALWALKQATSTIPIVMAANSDPVGLGLVQSLSRPGGNITGLSLQTIETTGKRLELIREIVPGDAPIAVVWNGTTLANWRAAQDAARDRGWKLMSLEIGDIVELDRLLKSAVDAGAGALALFAAGILFPNRWRVAELVAGTRLPAIYELRQYVEAGGLISYGPEINDVWFRAAGYVDKILRGASPANLPVAQPTKFETVVNMIAARALNVTVPPALLVRADELIE